MLGGEPPMKKCPNCNTEHDESKKFCPACGTALVDCTKDAVEQEKPQAMKTMGIVKPVIALIMGYVLSLLLVAFPKIALIPILGGAYLIFQGIKSSYGFLFGFFGAGIGTVIMLLGFAKCVGD